VISIERSAEKWKEEDYHEIEKGDWYFAWGTISMTPRAPLASPREVTLWGQGAGYIEFFELPRLGELFEGVKDASDLRKKILTMTPEQILSMQGLTDQQKLERLVNDSVPKPARTKRSQQDAEEDNEVMLKRRSALARMELFGIADLDKLWELYRDKQSFIPISWQRHPDVQQFRAALRPDRFQLPAANASSNPSIDSKDWATFIEELREKKLLVPLLRTKLFNSETETVGYVVRLPRKPGNKIAGGILIAANDAEPEKLSFALEVEDEDWALGSWKKLFNAFFATFSGVVLAVISAIIGYSVFRRQQNKVREEEEREKFQDRKIEHSERLWQFFNDKGNYTKHLNGSGTDQEVVRSLRRALIEKSVYAILPRDEIQSLTQICDGPAPSGGVSRTKALDSLLRRNFREFMI
jgi:hypothetical protein